MRRFGFQPMAFAVQCRQIQRYLLAGSIERMNHDLGRVDHGNTGGFVALGSIIVQHVKIVFGQDYRSHVSEICIKSKSIVLFMAQAQTRSAFGSV